MLAIPQYRYGDTACGMRLDMRIELVQEIIAEQIISRGAMRVRRKAPAILQHQRMHDRH